MIRALVLAGLMLSTLAVPGAHGSDDLLSPATTEHAAATLASLSGSAGAEVEVDPRRVLVKFRPDVMRIERFALHRQLGSRVASHIGTFGIDVVEIASTMTPSAAAAAYSMLPRVAYAQPNYLSAIASAPDDPAFDLQWNLHNSGVAGVADADIDAPEGWALAGGALSSVADYTVAVIDTGVDVDHPDLAAKLWPCLQASTGGGSVTPGCPDAEGHGTHVTGIAAAATNNRTGIAGVAFDARVFMCRAFGGIGRGIGSDADIIACLGQVLERREAQDIRALNMSFGVAVRSPAVHDAIRAVAAAGILPVAAAGNDGQAAERYPAAFPEVVSVGATTITDGPAPFTNVSHTVELSAPGSPIMSTIPGGTSYDSGTSMSAPHVAGVAALVSDRTGLRGGALRERLHESVDDLGPPGWDPIHGFGRINLCRAMSGGSSCGGAGPPVPETGTGRIEGTTRNLLGVPIDLAMVRARGRSNEAARLTLPLGSFSMDVPAGIYIVTAATLLGPCRLAQSGQPVALVRAVDGVTKYFDWVC